MATGPITHQVFPQRPLKQRKKLTLAICIVMVCLVVCMVITWFAVAPRVVAKMLQDTFEDMVTDRVPGIHVQQFAEYSQLGSGTTAARPALGCKFVVAYMDLTNNYQRSIEVSTTPLRLNANNGSSYTSYPYPLGVNGWPEVQGQIPPGGRKRCCAAFEVPSDASPLTVTVETF